MWFLSILILISATTVSGQSIIGRVVDKSGQPLAEVNIVVKGRVIGAISKPDGTFELKWGSKSALLVFSRLGFKTHQLNVKKNTFVEITLEEDNASLDYNKGKPLKLPLVSKEDCAPIDMKLVFDFINSFTKESSKINVSSATHLENYYKVDSLILRDPIFSVDDVKFICLQLACTRDMEWKEDQIRGARIIDQGEVDRIFDYSNNGNGWLDFRRKYGECLSQLNIPVFTVNGEYCLFFWWTQCDYLVGHGNLGLYKKSHRKWKQVKIYRSGIS